MCRLCVSARDRGVRVCTVNSLCPVSFSTPAALHRATSHEPSDRCGQTRVFLVIGYAQQLSGLLFVVIIVIIHFIQTKLSPRLSITFLSRKNVGVRYEFIISICFVNSSALMIDSFSCAARTLCPVSFSFAQPQRPSRERSGMRDEDY